MEKMFPSVQRELNTPVSQFVSVASCPVTGHQTKSLALSSLHPPIRDPLGKMGASGMKGIREDKFVGNSDKQDTDRVTEQHSNVGPSNTADLNALQVTSLDA